MKLIFINTNKLYVKNGLDYKKSVQLTNIISAIQPYYNSIVEKENYGPKIPFDIQYIRNDYNPTICLLTNWYDSDDPNQDYSYLKDSIAGYCQIYYKNNNAEIWNFHSIYPNIGNGKRMLDGVVHYLSNKKVQYKIWVAIKRDSDYYEPALKLYRSIGFDAVDSNNFQYPISKVRFDRNEYLRMYLLINNKNGGKVK